MSNNRDNGNAAALRATIERIRGIGQRMPQSEFDERLPEIIAECDRALFEASARPEPPSDAAKMREALEDSQSLLESFSRGEYGAQVREQMQDNRAALAAPARNCDVGTAKEQTERFEAFCRSNMQYYRDMFGHDDEGRLDGWDCREDCPVGRMIDAGEAVADHCQLAWAQMPYKAEGDSK